MTTNQSEELHLHFNVSNQLAPLATQMIEEQLHDLGVFETCYIVTQTAGMNQWLTQEIANIKGICAQVSYIQPADLIMNIYRAIVDEYTVKISRSNIDWLIYKVLSETSFQKKYPLQAAFYMQDNVEDSVKKWELAATVADLFDQYQIYRHTLIKDWRKQQKRDLEEKYDWQFYIWNKIINTAGIHFPDMTQMHEDIMQALQNPEKIKLLKRKYRRIAFFGISILTPFHYQLIYEIAKHIPCHFYLLNPAPDQFWEHDSSIKEIIKYNKAGTSIQGNNLLTQWGKVLQQTFKILNQDDALLNRQVQIGVAPPAPKHLLGKIQEDIFNNAPKTQQLYLNDIKDGSIYISAQYSIYNEVQTLYNHILHTISTNAISDFTERDILVITTDVQLYAPYIKAVFDNAPFKFQYAIADEAISSKDQVVKAFLELLQIQYNDLTVEQVLNLLDYEAIRSKFSIADPLWIREIIEAANIRYGIENDQQDDTYLVSWQHGLKKLMLGICYESSHEYTFHNESIISAEVPDSQSSMDQIIRLYQFVTQIIQHLKQRKQPQTLAHWQTYIEASLLSFFQLDNEQVEEAYIQLLKSIQQFQDIQPYLEDITIPFEVIKTRLEQNLDVYQQQNDFLSRGITFCAPLHFRSIPFKYIGFLGLDFDKFPRKEQHEDWNIIKNHRQIGDRNKKDNDKHLFLESLLSAKEILYLSYIGKSNADNSTLPPSIIIEELIDYIQDGIQDGTDVKETLIIQYPLQSYSTKYNQPNSPYLPNYLIKAINQYPIQLSKTHTAIKSTKEHMEIKDLILLATDSIQYYYNHYANIYLEVYDNTAADTENFDLNPLETWKLYQELLQQHADESSIEASLQRIYLEGKLPLKNTGALYMEKLKSSVQQYWHAIERINTNMDKAVHAVQLSLPNGYTLSGTLDNIFEKNLIHHKTGKSTFKYRLQAYIELLIGKAAGIIESAYILTEDTIFESQSISQEAAIDRLCTITDLATKGMESLLIFNTLLQEKLVEPVDFPSMVRKAYDKLQYPAPYFKLMIEHTDLKQHYEGYKDIMQHIALPALEIFNKK